MAAKLGLQTEGSPSKFADIPGLQSGKYEAGVSSFTINDERKQQVNMVSYFNAGTQWGTKKGNPSGIQLDNAARRSPLQPPPCRRPRTCPSATRTARAPATRPSPSTATRTRARRRPWSPPARTTPCWPTPRCSAYAVKQTNGQLELFGDIYDAAPYGYVIEKDQADFAQAIADAVSALISDGTYKTILEKWGVQAGAIDNPAVNP